MPTDGDYCVEVIYPSAERQMGQTRCTWYRKHGATMLEERPVDPGQWEWSDPATYWEDTFSSFATVDAARRFADYTARHLRIWPDTSQGLHFGIRILHADLVSEIYREDGIIGSDKPV
jgi:hypothetical protein